VPPPFGALENSDATRAAVGAVRIVRLAVEDPGREVKRRGLRRIDDEVAGEIVAGPHERPRIAAVRRFVDAPLRSVEFLAVCRGRQLGLCVDDARIARLHRESAEDDTERPARDPGVLDGPVRAAVGALENSERAGIAVGSRPHDVRVVRIDGQTEDGVRVSAGAAADGDSGVGRVPRIATIDALVDPCVVVGDEHRVLVGLIDANVVAESTDRTTGAHPRDGASLRESDPGKCDDE